MTETLKKTYELYKPFRRSMLGVFVFILFGKVLSLVAPYFLGRSTDALFAGEFSRAYWLILGMFVIHLIRLVVLMYYKEIYELRHIDHKIPEHMNTMTLRKMLGFSLGQHINENSGLKQSVINRGQHSLTSMAYSVVYQVVPTIIEVILMIGALMYLSWTMGLVVLVGVSLFTAIVFYMNVSLMPEFRAVEKQYNENSRFQGEVLRNVDLVKVNAQEERAQQECDDNLKSVHKRERLMWERFVLLASARNMTLALTRLAVGVLGVYYVSKHYYTPGTLVIFWMWSGNALNEIGSVGNMHRQLMSMYASIRKYFSMLNLETDIVVRPDAIRPSHFEGRIEFRNVTLTYKKRTNAVSDSEDEDDRPKVLKDDGKPSRSALKNVNLIINPGERIALVGESGAGKTTFVHALMRAQDPDEGRILIDGHDLRDLDLEQFLTSVGVVPQHVPLFDQSIRYNITYGLTNGHVATEEEIDRVAKMACIDRFFARLESGYDTYIGERGVKLSGGERQRVGIARALIKNPDILIFDEATSNLDSQNEALIRESIEKASEGRTTIIIAHRFSTIRNVDRIFVFDKGEIVGSGTHEQLLLDCESYQQLVRHQMAEN